MAKHIRCIIPCSNCGKILEKPRSMVEGKKDVYCNRDCYKVHQKTILKGMNNPNFGKKWSEEKRKKTI